MADQAKSAQAKPRLGRGLSSLIINSSTHPAQAEPGVQADGQPAGYISDGHAQGPAGGGPLEIPIEQIAANPFQPRRDFKAEELAELTQSIIQQGVLQPIVVTANIDPQASQPYMLIAGERRLRASRHAGLARIPCIIRQATRQQMLEWALIENVQRADLNPVERANAYREYMDRFSLTAAQVADRLGEPRTTIANYLRIVELCDAIQKLMIDGSLTFGHAKVLAGLSAWPDSQLSLARQAANCGYSVRILEGLAVRCLKEAGISKDPPSVKAKAAHVRDLEERLTTAVGTRVTILPFRSRNRGRVVIEYYSLDDFDRIAGKLGVLPEA